MDIGKLFKPAEKRLDISQFTGEPDFITLKRFPMKMRYQIEQSKLNGLDREKFAEALKKNNIDPKKENNVIGILLTTPGVIREDHDGGYNSKILILEWGVDIKNHSLGIELNKEFWEKLSDANEELFEYIYNAVTSYQEEMSLGKTAGKPEVSEISTESIKTETELKAQSDTPSAQ